jgi:hypothetical protein
LLLGENPLHQGKSRTRLRARFGAPVALTLACGRARWPGCFRIRLSVSRYPTQEEDCGAERSGGKPVR